MKIFTLTDQEGRTHDGCQWGENVTIETSGEGELCGPGFTHWYTSPLLAVLLNPIHANIANPQLWEGEGEGEPTNFHGGLLKVDCTRATTIRRVPLPTVTTAQWIKFGILCAKHVFGRPKWTAWANACLSGDDRSAEEMAAEAEWEAAEAAEVEAEATEAEAARAAWAAWVAWATRRATRAAWAAWVGVAAQAAVAAAGNIPLADIAAQAVE